MYVSATAPELDDTISSGFPSVRTTTITGFLKSYIPVDINFTLEVSMGRYSPQVQDDGTIQNRWIETRDRTSRIGFTVAYADGPGVASGDHLLNGAPATSGGGGTGGVYRFMGVDKLDNTQMGVSASSSGNVGFAAASTACALVLVLVVAVALRFRSSAATAAKQPARSDSAVSSSESGGHTGLAPTTPASPKAPRVAFAELGAL